MNAVHRAPFLVPPHINAHARQIALENLLPHILPLTSLHTLILDLPHGVRARRFESTCREYARFAEDLGREMPQMVRFVIRCGCERGGEERLALTDEAMFILVLRRRAWGGRRGRGGK
jgi:hypothetical protein